MRKPISTIHTAMMVCQVEWLGLLDYLRNGAPWTPGNTGLPALFITGVN
jgi:hypothetical protein